MRERLMMIFLLGILGALGFGVYEKEQLKHHGETVLLELAPVDPRSLMQGDYMRLSYRIERDKRFSELNAIKYIIVRIDEQSVAHFARADAGEPLARDERRLRVKMLKSRLRIVPRSFLFQEGHAKHYDRARYGVFRVDESGKNLLVDLADEQREVINPEQSDTPE